MTKLTVTIEARNDDAAVRALLAVTDEIRLDNFLNDELRNEYEIGGERWRAECKVERGEG